MRNEYFAILLCTVCAVTTTFAAVSIMIFTSTAMILQKQVHKSTKHGMRTSLQQEIISLFPLRIFSFFSFSVLLLLHRPSIFSKYFPPFPSLFFFSSVDQIFPSFSFSKYFPHLPSPWRGVEYDQVYLSFLRSVLNQVEIDLCGPAGSRCCGTGKYFFSFLSFRGGSC